MRISDWSSDVCSSDLIVGDLLDLFVDALALAFPAGSAFAGGFVGLLRLGAEAHLHHLVVRLVDEIGALRHDARGVEQAVDEIGRASCRERVCHYVLVSSVAVVLKKKSINKLHKF